MFDANQTKFLTFLLWYSQAGNPCVDCENLLEHWSSTLHYEGLAEGTSNPRATRERAYACPIGSIFLSMKIMTCACSVQRNHSCSPSWQGRAWVQVVHIKEKLEPSTLWKWNDPVHLVRSCNMYGVKCEGEGIPKIRSLGEGNRWAQAHILGMSPACRFLPIIIEHKAEVIMNINMPISWGAEGGRFLHLLLKGGWDGCPWKPL